MLPEIVTFNKSMQCRLQEYQLLFDNLETPCSEITDAWGSIFEDLTAIGVGWQALWLLSERNCKKYDVFYPTAVIVKVYEFNWFELTATVEVLAVQEDIVIPSMINVPVIELHPIKVQSYDETELKDIGDWLDKCRYFFNNLWYPWDAKLAVNIMDWCESHLRNRLKMQYDIKNGVFDKTIANYIKQLCIEAHNIGDISEKFFSAEDDRLTVVKRYLHKKAVKAELDLFEEPDLRYGMILLKRKEKRLRNSSDKTDYQEVKFVWISGTCQSLLNYLEITQSVIDKNASLKVFGSLQEALNCSSTNDTIILPPAVHVLNQLRGIEAGGIIRGLDMCESIIMPDMATLPKAILFECFGFVEMENLTISKPSGIVFQVFSGILKLKKCRIISTEKNSTSRGIVVVSGCKLFLEECEVQGFGMGIALQADTYASVTDSEISNCHEGIKLIQGASLSLQNVVISNCSTFGIRLETLEIDSESPLIGDLNLLENDEHGCTITSKSVTFKNNGKGNVLIKQSELACNFEETLPSDISNEVICISDEEDSEDNSLEEIQISLNKAL